MRALFSTLWNLAWTAIAAALFVGLMWFFARAHSSQWRILSSVYSGRARTRPAARKLESIVITGRGQTRLAPGGIGYRVYAGVQIAIHEDGLAISLLPPFNIMCPPLFLPYDEMEVAPTSWALWPDPVAIRMRNAPQADLILARDTVRWLRDHSDRSPFQPTFD